MKNSVIEKIYSDKYALRFLRENSHWYKYLNRKDEAINDMIEEMKARYGLRFKDKVDKARTSLDLINAFMSVTKE